PSPCQPARVPLLKSRLGKAGAWAGTAPAHSNDRMAAVTEFLSLGWDGTAAETGPDGPGGGARRLRKYGIRTGRCPPAWRATVCRNIERRTANQKVEGRGQEFAVFSEPEASARTPSLTLQARNTKPERHRCAGEGFDSLSGPFIIR